jgi:hypothetical protein
MHSDLRSLCGDCHDQPGLAAVYPKEAFGRGAYTSVHFLETLFISVPLN